MFGPGLTVKRPGDLLLALVQDTQYNLSQLHRSKTNEEGGLLSKANRTPQ